MATSHEQRIPETWTWRDDRPTIEKVLRWIDGDAVSEADTRAGARLLSIENQRLRSVLGHCPKAIAVLDPRGHLCGYNSEFAGLFGTPPTLGVSIDGAFDQEDAAMLREVIAAAAGGKRTAALVQLDPGNERRIELFVATLPIPDEPSFGVILAGEDRTREVHDEAELRGALEAMQARALGVAGEAWREMLGGAHTQAIDTLRELLDDDRRARTLGDGEVRDRLCAILAAIENASARMGTPHAASQRGLSDARECAHRAARLVRPRVGTHRVYVDVRVSRDLLVGVDGPSLVHVLSTVLRRAMRAIEVAARPGHIEVFSAPNEPTRNAVRIHVRDDGLGMQPSEVQGAFELIGRPTDDAELALALSRRILAESGGTMRLLSDVERGTEVILDLPLASS